MLQSAVEPHLKGHPSTKDIYAMLQLFSTPDKRTPHCKGQKMPSHWCPVVTCMYSKILHIVVHS